MTLDFASASSSSSPEFKPLGWGVVGTGAIATTFARALRGAGGDLIGVFSRQQERGAAFAARQGTRAVTDFAALLADPSIEAIYVAVPHPYHMRWAVRAARAGKHVLCEKPLALNAVQSRRMIEASRRARVHLGEAFMYRFHPQMAAILEVVRAGELGEVRWIEASFAFDSGSDSLSRLHDPWLGGGAILDVGCYTTSFVREVVGAAQGRAFAEPTRWCASGRLGREGTDDRAALLLEFEGGVGASCLCAVRLAAGSSARIVGTRATLRVPSPWFCAPSSRPILEARGGSAHTLEFDATQDAYTHQIRAFSQTVRSGDFDGPQAEAERSGMQGNAILLEAWRRDLGVIYPHETSAHAAH